MKKVAIYYTSKTGITKRLGENIRDYLNEKGFVTEIRSTDDVSTPEINGADYVFLGCWTGGLMLFFQGPSKKWITFAKQLPELDPSRTILFTTYKIRTGSMFRNMRKYLKTQIPGAAFAEIKSRNSNLNEENKSLINNFLNN